MSENKEKKRRIGRPTKYRDEYCEQMIEYFSIEPFYYEEISYYDKNGNIRRVEKKKTANKMPAFHRFAKEIDVNVDSLHEWSRIFPDFTEAYRICKELQKWFLIENGLNSVYNAAFAKFVAINITDMRDVIEHIGDKEHPVEIVINKSYEHSVQADTQTN